MSEMRQPHLFITGYEKIHRHLCGNAHGGASNQEIGSRVIERLFHNIDKIDIPELKERKISVSVGATFYPADRNDSFEALYQRADKGMYESKHREGNVVTFRKQEQIS